VSPQTGLLKSTLLQLDSTFSERNYGASSFLALESSVEQSEAVRQQKSRSNPLHRARGEEYRKRWRKRTQQRCNREDDRTDDEQAPPSEMIAERSTQQQKRGQREQIGVDHPLNLGRSGAVARADGG